MSEEITSQILKIDEKISKINVRISSLDDERTILKGKLEDLTTERQNLQKLMGLGERAQEIREAEKRLTEIEKQAHKERRRIYDAQHVVVEAVKNLEALNMEARALSKKFPEVRFVHFAIPQPIKKFSYHGAVPTSWAKL